MKNKKKGSSIQNIKLYVQFWIGDSDQPEENPSGKIVMEEAYCSGFRRIDELRIILIYFFKKVVRMIIDLAEKVSETKIKND